MTLHIEEWSHDFSSNTIIQVKILTGPVLRDQIPEMNNLNCTLCLVFSIHSHMLALASVYIRHKYASLELLEDEL